MKRPTKRSDSCERQPSWVTPVADLFVSLFILIAVGADLIRQRTRRAS